MQTTQPTGGPHRNHGLFSDHYLNATLPTRPDWRGLADEARPVMEEIASPLVSYTPSENEAQVEEELVRPVLRLLGHTFEVQPALATPEGTKRPDYRDGGPGSLGLNDRDVRAGRRGRGVYPSAGQWFVADLGLCT